MERAEVENRRWTRLNPEILLPCRVRVLGTRLQAELRDLSPGGVGLALPPCSDLPPAEHLRLAIRFRGQPEVVREGRLIRFDPTSGNAGLEWPSEPSAWSGLERRSRLRVHLPQDILFGRIPLVHAHRVWSRVRIVDLSSDLGFQVETVGGPGYMLPGHRGPFQLDLPGLTDQRWEAQVIWCRPGLGQATRLGLRILDPDADLAQALGEWLELDRLRPPLTLQELGFRKAALPGQFRFRKVEEKGERKELDEFLGTSAGGTCIRLGVWDGPLLVGGALLRPAFPDGKTCRLEALRIRREWVVPDVFLGLWEQTIRHFLSTGSDVLSTPCPRDREALLRLAGLRPPHHPDADWSISRRSVLWGEGLPLPTWHVLYAEVGTFALQRRMAAGLFPDLFRRNLRVAAWTLLRDWLLPKTRRRLHRQIDLWARDAT
jgi:hypothetical protein